MYIIERFFIEMKYNFYISNFNYKVVIVSIRGNIVVVILVLLVLFMIWVKGFI